MPPERASIPGQSVPSELLNQWEDGTWLGSCDWGGCDNKQIGWASCDCGDTYCGPDHYLAICADCLERGSSKSEPRHVVVRSVTFAQIEALNA